MAFKFPKVFAAGTKAVAEDVNDNFSAAEDEINNTLRPGLFESGDLKPTARPAAPTGWLLCNGAAVSRTTYKALFDAIGTAYGAGDGATTFNLPDYRGRGIVGPDEGAGRLTASNQRGQSGGAQNHTLSAAQLPAHGHAFSATTSTNGGHSHVPSTGGSFIVNTGFHTFNINASGGSYTQAASTNHTGDHAHSVSGTTANTGSGSAHNNMAPYQVSNVLIKI